VIIRWFSDYGLYARTVERIKPNAHVIEAVLEKHETVYGFCTNCAKMADFQVSVDAWLGTHPNLREGMRCKRCGMTNRSRILLDAVLESIPEGKSPRIALLEAFGPLYESMAQRFPSLSSSEYFGRDQPPGTPNNYRGRWIPHQDATKMSYADDSFDVVCHNDVLEHIYNFTRALSEMKRVTRPGGAVVFGVPFFYDQEKTQVRGTEAADGSITHIEEPEYHGDGVRAGGVYTFYHYGRDLRDAIK